MVYCGGQPGCGGGKVGREFMSLCKVPIPYRTNGEVLMIQETIWFLLAFLILEFLLDIVHDLIVNWLERRKDG